MLGGILVLIMNHTFYIEKNQVLIDKRSYGILMLEKQYIELFKVHLYENI